jgi:hypothetical protein
MPAIPTVTIVVNDNGASAALAVPLSSIQLKIGCAIGGTVNRPYATTNPSALQTEFIGGPLVEAGGLVCQAGNVCLAVKCPIVTLGTATAVVATTPGGSGSVVTVTLDSTFGAWDTYFVRVRVVTGGTIGTAGIVLAISLDAGKNEGAPIPLGTATTLYLGTGTISTAVAGGTGVQLAFAAGTLVAGDTFRFSTVGPQWNTTGVAAAVAAYMASQYAVAGVGSAHLVGACAGSTDIATMQTALQTGTSGYVYQRALVELRDALAPAAWGGSGETEAAWMTALETFVAGNVAQPRIDADGGWYNTPSAYANAAGGLPSYRRPLAWSHAVRRTQIPLQRRAGRVKDGPYANIVVNPGSDPADGFVYHDERVTPGLNAARIGSAMTWPKKGAGFFQCQEPLLSAPGSQFTEIAIGNVLDVACDIGYAAGVEEVSDDLLLQANGTLDPVALGQLQTTIQLALDEGMVQTPLVSSVTALVSPTANVRDTGNIPVTISVTPRGYVNAISETINLSTGA